MGSIISKWVLPGFLTVIIGTIGTVFFTQSTIETDLVEKSDAAISVAGEHSASEWAQISFIGRDGLISGTTTNASAADALIAEISGLHGVRSITSDITLAPTASPYPFKAILGEDGAIALSGGVPSFAMRDALLEQTGGTDAGLELLSGAPHGDWLEATGFAVSQLDGLSSGEATLSDLSLSVSGLAKSADAYDTTTSGLMGSLPAGLELASVSVEPALIDEYVFNASRFDGQTTLSGFVPDEATRTKVGEMTGASTSALVLASGAPAGFGASLDYGLGALGHMSNGNFDVNSTDISVSGEAASSEDFEALSAFLAAAPEGANVVMASVEPAIEPAPPTFRWSAEKFSNGKIVLSGSVSDDATRAAILSRTGNNAVDNMVITPGAPATFYEDSLVGISAIKELETGRTGYSTDGWFLNGQPETIAASNAAANSLATARTIADDWNINLTEAPDVTPYTWAASKSSNGQILLTGNVPDNATRAAILARAGNGAIDKMVTSNGAPATFYEDALVGISAIKELETGRTGHSTNGWFLNGLPKTVAASNAAANSLATARTIADDWNINLAEAPDVTPYTWAASKSSNGQILLTGNVPDNATRAAILARAGNGAIDKMVTSNGAPATFYEDALVGISAIKELEMGRIGHSTNGWFLNGLPKTVAASNATTNSLATARTIADDWNINLAPAPDVAPYTWSTEKSADGSMSIVGHVPDEATRAAILARAGGNAADHMITANGAPATFYEDALVGISSLSDLDTGRTGHSASGWFLVGDAPSQALSDTASNGLITARTSSDLWYVSISAPADPVVQEETAVEEAAVETPATPVEYGFEAILPEDGTIALSGMVPSERSQTYLGLVSGGVVTSDLVVTPEGAPNDFVENSRAGIRGLLRLSEGRMAFENGTWSLVGKAANANARSDALNQIDGLAAYSQWQTDIKLPTWAEICQTQISDLTSQNSIQFNTASAIITQDSLLDLQNVAVFLHQCPDAAVHIEGHTDNQGGFASNLQLSTDRAEAVVTALAKYGINQERLFSVGYGEDRPIASNDTAEGRQANRRIVFTIVE